MRPLGLLVLVVLGACATTREAQVRSALLDAGVPVQMATCMAEPLARDLSTSQLRSLGRMAKMGRTAIQTMEPEEALAMLRRDADPETVQVVVRAGLGCVLRG